MVQFADGSAGLQAFGQAVLDAARRDDRGRVHDLLASAYMTDPELDAVLGPELASEHRGRYHLLMETLVNRGALELVAQILDRKYDAVDVIADPDPALSARLPSRPRLYALRFRRAADRAGLRYDFFLYHDGHWVTGNLLGPRIVGPTDLGALGPTDLGSMAPSRTGR